MTSKDLRNIHTTRNSCRDALPSTNMALKGVIHIVHIHKGEVEEMCMMPNVHNCIQGERVGSGLCTYSKKIFLDHKISKLSFLCKTEAITLPFIIAYIKKSVNWP